MPGSAATLAAWPKVRSPCSCLSIFSRAYTRTGTFMAPLLGSSYTAFPTFVKSKKTPKRIRKIYLANNAFIAISNLRKGLAAPLALRGKEAKS